MAELKTTKPKCDRPTQCRIQATAPLMSTLLHHSPVYDGFGNNHNPGRNKISTTLRCSTCGAEWQELS
jgi:hypothetical protein